MPDKPLLIMFLGAPGSGKSYFARHLAEKTKAIRLNGDSMRIALYKTLEDIEAQPDNNVVNQQTFGAIDYVVTQILKAGHTVVYDAHHNKRSIREGLESVAAEHGATPIVVWIKTPHEVALKRGQTREPAADSRRLTEERMLESMSHHMAHFNEPIDTEKVIVIDGLIPFEEQYISYTAQLKKLLA